MRKKNLFIKAAALAMAVVMVTATASCGTDEEKETTKKVSEKSTDSKYKDSTDEETSQEDDSEEETKETDEETSAEETSSGEESTENNTDGNGTGSSENTNGGGGENNGGNTGNTGNTNSSGNANNGGNTNSGGNTGNNGNTGSSVNTGSSGNTNNTGSTNNTGNTNSGTGTVVNKGTAIKNRVSVHDPSIVVGKDKAGKKCYYIFGSHMAWAKSYDLQNWEIFTNNINSSYNTLFASAFDWADNGDPVYDNSGNMWAPDVIWNPNMNKWCMYMSINGCSWNSSIVLLTADSLEGDWTFVGPVIYSGFTASGTYSYTQTDYAKATGDANFSKSGRYYGNPFQFSDGTTKCEASTWNCSTGAHAIDPCVIFDKNGDLYMSYGSWSGGIWMIKLDKTTGLRDYTHKYGESDLTNASEDPYMGKKISGATGATGEASYIVYDSTTDYYYLYVTYGGLTANGGYHIRLFRSKNIDGTYVDYDGTRANARGGNRDGIGIKLFGNYNFSSLSTSNANARKGYKSGGHNSAFIDDDGSHYLIYHTRFNLGNEYHQVRVHQQFMNEDGWLVTAVYEYLGSKISTTGYSMDDMAGTYEMVNMGTSSAVSNVGMLSNGSLTLNSNGTISGTYSGTWSYNNQYVTLNINGTAYKGVFFKQYDESSSHKEVMTFTVIGADTSIWGTK